MLLNAWAIPTLIALVLGLLALLAFSYRATKSK
jgi:hypothetical protein